jgi:hypothetical protein
LWIVADVWWVVTGVLQQALGGPAAITFTSFYTRSSTQSDGSTVSRTIGHSGPAPVAVALVVLIIIGALWGLFTFKVWQGRQWSRILLTVLGGLGCLFTLVQLFAAFSSPGGALRALLDLFLLGFALAAIITMYSSAAGSYFTPR